MRKIHNELSELDQLYREYEGVDRFVINEDDHLGYGTVVVLDGSKVPGSFTKLMSSPNVSVSWVEPSQTVNIKLIVQGKSRYEPNSLD